MKPNMQALKKAQIACYLLNIQHRSNVGCLRHISDTVIRWLADTSHVFDSTVWPAAPVYNATPTLTCGLRVKVKVMIGVGGVQWGQLVLEGVVIGTGAVSCKLEHSVNPSHQALHTASEIICMSHAKHRQYFIAVLGCLSRVCYTLLHASSESSAIILLISPKLMQKSIGYVVNLTGNIMLMRNSLWQTGIFISCYPCSPLLFYCTFYCILVRNLCFACFGMWKGKVTFFAYHNG